MSDIFFPATLETLVGGRLNVSDSVVNCNIVFFSRQKENILLKSTRDTRIRKTLQRQGCLVQFTPHRQFKLPHT